MPYFYISSSILPSSARLHPSFFEDRQIPLSLTAPVQCLTCGVYAAPFLRFSCEAGHVTCSIIGTGLKCNMLQLGGWNQVRSNPYHGRGFITHSSKGSIQGKIQGLLIPLFHHSPRSRPLWDTSEVSSYCQGTQRLMSPSSWWPTPEQWYHLCLFLITPPREIPILATLLCWGSRETKIWGSEVLLDL